jgi:hypothetical protein
MRWFRHFGDWLWSRGRVDSGLELKAERRLLIPYIYFLATTRKLNFFVTCRGIFIPTGALRLIHYSPFSSESLSSINPCLRFLFVSRLFLGASFCIKYMVNKLFTTPFVRMAASKFEEIGRAT